jgi:hypothetical protein
MYMYGFLFLVPGNILSFLLIMMNVYWWTELSSAWLLLSGT